MIINSKTLAVLLVALLFGICYRTSENVMSFPKDTPEEHRDGVGTMCERFARPGGVGQGAKQSPVFK